MAMKCGRCRLASHCIQFAVSGSRLPWPSNTSTQCSQRASTPILLVLRPRLHSALGELPAAAVARRAGGGRIPPRQPANRERDARARGPTACGSSAAGSPAARRAARRRRGRGSRQTRSGRRRTSRVRAPEWSRASSAIPRPLRRRRRCPDRPSRSGPPRPSSRHSLNPRRVVARTPIGGRSGRWPPKPRAAAASDRTRLRMSTLQEKFKV